MARGSKFSDIVLSFGGSVISLLSGAFGLVATVVGILWPGLPFNYAMVVLGVLACIISAYVAGFGAGRRSVANETITVFEAAQIVLGSQWGWAAFRRLRHWSFVRDEVAQELTRAARGGKIVFTGNWPNSAKTHEIDRGYWHHASIADDRIRDPRNYQHSYLNLTAHNLREGLMVVENLRVPADHVLRHWPGPFVLYKLWVRCVVALQTRRLPTGSYGVNKPIWGA